MIKSQMHTFSAFCIRMCTYTVEEVGIKERNKCTLHVSPSKACTWKACIPNKTISQSHHIKFLRRRYF